MDKLKLSPPWFTFYRKIDALLGCDPEINVEYDEYENHIRVFVNNASKAEALGELLPTERSFGNVTVSVSIIQVNSLSENPSALYQTALKGNPAFSFLTTVDNGGHSLCYVVFKKEVVQFFNDDISDINGNFTTIYENIARDVFVQEEEVYFCTDSTK